MREFEGETVGDVFGVDYGAWLCYDKGIEMKAACGDFDSVSKSQKQALLTLDIPIYELEPMKDYTDFEYSLSLVKDYDLIYVYGALGGRRDHEYLHVQFALKDPRIVLIDGSNKIRKVEEGTYIVKKDNYRYLSFIVIEQAVITIENVKYPLSRRQVYLGDAYLSSNEILEEQAFLCVHSGSFLMIQSNEV
ncbi:thiamine diphosphokinase [Erysipelothrix urinaevulpis]|uniref:thiamine diphosphokinase n=1 Tax=Erysipelothrix urinaevulpis TaxID=2683717 RepID=UPI0039EFCF05